MEINLYHDFQTLMLEIDSFSFALVEMYSNLNTQCENLSKALKRSFIKMHVWELFFPLHPWRKDRLVNLFSLEP